MIKVLVCADSPVEVAGLAAMVSSGAGLVLAGTALGRDTLQEVRESSQADVLIEVVSRLRLEDSISIETPDRPGVQEEVEEGGPARVVIVADPNLGFSVADLLRSSPSIRALLPGGALEGEIHAAVQAAAEGLIVIHQAWLSELVSSPPLVPAAPAGQQLTPRETEVLRLLADGLANKEIAWRLKISDHTVKFHVTSIFNKLGVSSRAEAAAVGMRRGLIPI